MNRIIKTIFSLFMVSLLSACEKKYQVDGAFGDYYTIKCNQFIDSLKEDKWADVVFVGDSITDWCPLSTYYPEYKIANRGIAGDTTTGLLKRMDFSVYDLKGKVYYLMIGINNVTNMFDDYEQILQGMKENIYHNNIIITNLLPVRWEDKNAVVIEANKTIKSLAEKYNYTFVDLYTPMSLENDHSRINEELFADGLHPNEDGYQVMASYVRPIIQSFLGK